MTMAKRKVSKGARALQSHSGMPRSVIVEGAVDQLERQGATVFGPTEEDMTAGDLMTLLTSGIAQGLIDPDKPLKLEDPNLTRPWDIRRARVEGDEIVLDVWGE